jgi:hypothetical protein
VLTSLLLLMCFYFDLLEDYDLISMILGFLLCIIVQFSLLSYYFREEMRKWKLDEIGVSKLSYIQLVGRSKICLESWIRLNLIRS